MKNFTLILKGIGLLTMLAISNTSIAQAVLYTDTFELGWGTWNDGGNRCDLVSSSPLDLGKAIKLTANNGANSSTYSNGMDLTSYSSASIQFSTRTNNFANGEDFFLEFSNNDGGSWSIVKQYIKGPDFANNKNYNFTETVTNASYNFTTNCRFRFRCDASNIYDIMYLDNIVIRVVTPGPEIDVRGNTLSIANGDASPSTGDNTDYGNVNVGTVITKSFTIHNSGIDNLNISAITLTDNTDFVIVGTPFTTPVTPGGFTTFDLRFKTLTPGSKSSNVVITNNDSDEGSYTFLVVASAQQNFFDSDGDGIYDNVDIDDDNDGIKDSEEELACKRSSVSTSVNFKFLNETFGTGTGRTTINTNNYAAITSYCYEDGAVGPNTTECPFQSSSILDDGEYTVVSKIAGATAGDPDNIHGDLAWTSSPDHTPSDTNGRMAVFNASFTPGVFYETNISGVLTNIPITYSFWAMNIMAKDLYAGTILPDITVQFLDFSNNVLATINTGPFGRCNGGSGNNDCAQSEWLQFTTSVNLGNITDFKVRFINNASGGGGNDLAIDDIVIAQTLCDTDGDLVADVFDLDSDNDGIPDVVEAGLGTYSNGKATLKSASWVDANGNGMLDSIEGHVTLDSDGDATPNYLDLDSDNDSIFDVDESGVGNTTAVGGYINGDGDIDGDGIGDGPDSDLTREKDVESDGLSEYFGDGILDIYDYYNGATFNTSYGNSGQGIGNTYFVKDTDGDGKPDYMDITSDGTTFDISHTLYANLDANANGIIDGNSDADGDGISDLFDTNDASFGSPRDINRKLHLYLDGRNDYAQDVSVTSALAEATIMTWIKMDNDIVSPSRILGQNQFHLDIIGGKYTVNAKGTTVTGPRIAKNRWVHIAATYSKAKGFLKLYINGKEEALTAVSGSLPVDTSLFTIGKNSTDNTLYFKGYYDEIRVFSKALSDDELHKMVYQEIKNNGGTVRGEVIPRDITNYVNPTTITPLTWTSLKRYYRMDTYKGNIIDDLTTATIDVSAGARIYNTKLIDVQTAPLPFVTKQIGTLTTAINDTFNGINGDDVTLYDWSIVKIKNKAVSYNANQKHLGLFVDEFDANANPIKFEVLNNSELNVSWYLKLDGSIDLEGESQLVQNDDSMLDVTSVGKLDRDQQGTADKFTYNYWSSPVGVRNATSNNNSYRVTDVMRDGGNNITWLTSGYNGTAGNPIGIADYWVWKFANRTDDAYSQWQHVRSTGTMSAGEGFTMKGPGTGPISAEQNYVFTGKPNNGNIDLTLASGNDYLVGNPYPSAIDGVKFILDNGPVIAGNGPSITGTLYFWEHWGGGSHVLAEYQGGYATFNLSGGAPSASEGSTDPDVGTGGLPTKIPGRYIPISQGFFVVAEGSGGTIKFNNGQRIFAKENANSVFVRPAGTSTTNYAPDGEDLRMKFRIGFNSPNTIHRQLLLTVDENATQGIDWGYDALNIDDQIDDMYWMISDSKFNIQGVDAISAASVLPLGFHLKNAGINTISIDYLENVPEDVEIFIHDILADTYHNLRQSAFSFNLPGGNYFDRYEITFQDPAVLTIIENELSQLNAHYNIDLKSIVVINPTLEKVKSIELFNLLGQSIYTIKKVENATYSEYKVKNLSTGTYIIKMVTESGSVSKKVLVK